MIEEKCKTQRGNFHGSLADRAYMAPKHGWHSNSANSPGGKGFTVSHKRTSLDVFKTLSETLRSSYNWSGLSSVCYLRLLLLLVPLLSLHTPEDVWKKAGIHLHKRFKTELWSYEASSFKRLQTPLLVRCRRHCFVLVVVVVVVVVLYQLTSSYALDLAWPPSMGLATLLWHCWIAFLLTSKISLTKSYCRIALHKT